MFFILDERGKFSTTQKDSMKNCSAFYEIHSKIYRR